MIPRSAIWPKCWTPAPGSARGRKVDLSDEAAVTVVLASGGYPGPHELGIAIDGLDAAAAVSDAVVFHSGTAERDGRVVTAGGRVLAATGWGRAVADARRAYDAAGASRSTGCIDAATSRPARPRRPDERRGGEEGRMNQETPIVGVLAASPTELPISARPA